MAGLFRATQDLTDTHHESALDWFPGREPRLVVVRAFEHAGARGAFSLRRGGTFDDPLDGPDASNSPENQSAEDHSDMEILCEDLGIDPTQLVRAKQVHGDNVTVVRHIPDKPPRADAVIVKNGGLFATIRTADCLPILLIDPVNRVAAGVHAGWKGTVKRITRKTVEIMMRQFGCLPADMIAALGPSINPCCYEVDAAVLDPFRQEFPFAESFIHRLDLMCRTDGGRVRTQTPDPLPATKPPSESYRLDIAAANRFELISAGIPPENILSAALCTACYPELFFSYRREGTQAGRHIAVVGFPGK